MKKGLKCQRSHQFFQVRIILPFVWLILSWKPYRQCCVVPTSGDMLGSLQQLDQAQEMVQEVGNAAGRMTVTH